MFSNFFAGKSGIYMQPIYKSTDLGLCCAGGLLVFMPCIHTLQNLFMVHNHAHMSNNVMCLYLIVGNTMTYLNYDSDTQRHKIRSKIENVWAKRCRCVG